MSANVMLVPIGFIIDAYEGIGFKVCEEEQNITTLRRDEEIAFLSHLDGLVDLSFIAQDADACEVKDELLMYLASKHGAEYKPVGQQRK
jgi:hypothetical protein